MAGIRRIIRKTKPTSSTAIEDQLWPVNVALVLFGGFLAGVVIVHLHFDDPRWWMNGWLWLTLVVAAVIGAMAVLRYVSSRWIRRSMQLAVVISLMVNLAILVSTQYIEYARTAVREQASRDLISVRRPKVVPDYDPLQVPSQQQRPKQDFERPVETDTPEPELEEIHREEQEHKQQPTEIQPTPVPEPEKTVEATLVRKEDASSTVPRQSETTSQLSRQTRAARPTPNQTVAVPEPNNAPRQQDNAVRPAPSAVARRSATDSPTARPTPSPDVSAPQPRSTPALSRQRSADDRTPELTAKAAMPRARPQPQVEPRAESARAEVPTISQRTSPEAVQPRNTEATKQATTSPQKTAEPVETAVPEQVAQADPTPQRRENPNTEQPEVAQTPTPVAERQPRSTPRPDTRTVASEVAPTPSPNTAQPTPQPGATALARNATSRRVDRSPATRPDTANPQPAPQPVERRQVDPQPVERDPQVAQLTRQATNPSPLPSTTVAANEAAAETRRTESAEISPTSTAARKQSTEAPHTATSSALDATVATRREVPTREPTRSTGRQSAAQDAPSVASQETGTVTRSGAAANDAPRVETQAEQLAARSPARTSEGQLRATASEVARQPAASTSATASQQSLEAPASSPSTQLANRVSRRATEANQPALAESAVPSESPQRTTIAGSLASPVAVAQPSPAQASQDGQPSALAPAATALSKGEAGTAGTGNAANLDRSVAAQESPSLVASGSVRRAETTQNTPEGADLSPSQPTAIPRNVAGSERPASTLKADPVALATTQGAREPAELDATSSATTSRLTSNADAGEITATQGSVEVDLGPTRIVSESGASPNRAAGGGQPEMNFAAESDPRNPARSQPESTLGSLATNTRADVPTAPAADGTSATVALDANPQTDLARRTDAGGEQPVTGAAPSALASGPAAEPNAAELTGELALSRATAPSRADPGGAEAAAPEDDEDEEEKERARRVARAAAGGGPQLALAGPTLADQPVVPSQTGGDAGGPAGPEAVAATDLQRATPPAGSASGGPVAGRPANDEVAGAAPPGGGELAGPLNVARAERVDAPTGEAVAGGGTMAATRSALGPPITASTQADTVQVAGTPDSSGGEQGQPLAAQGVTVAKAAAGERGVPSAELPSAETAGSGQQTGLAGDTGDLQRREDTAGGGPALDQLADVGAPGRRGPLLQRVTDTRADGASPGDVGGSEPSDLGALADVGNVGPMRRQPTSALPVSVEAVEGPGGLGAEVSTDTGINSRRATADSDQVQIKASRFVRRHVGGRPDFNTAAVAAAEPFRRRASRNEGDTPGGSRGRPGPQTEEAIERGLAFLKRYQRTDGGWSLRGFPEDVSIFDSDAAATGLAVLAFQGGGYNHLEHKYADTVAAGLDYLIAHQKENGDLYAPQDGHSNQYAWLYSHSIAALALCEAYGMTQDAALREPAQKAIDFIVATQDRDNGGWRYQPGIKSDTSVTGWMMMALTSARFANLDVPQDALDRASHWLDQCQASPSERHLYCYNPMADDTPQTRLGREPSYTMTSVGLLMRLYSGWERDNPHMRKGADFLMQRLPALGSVAEPQHLKQRDTYYWYYATQFLFHMGGEHWDRWYRQLRPLLLNYQVQVGPFAGSWDPLRPVPDRWGPQAGRLYVTCLNLLSLEVHYRILPLYDRPNAGNP